MCFFLTVKWQVNYKLLICIPRSWGRQVLLVGEREAEQLLVSDKCVTNQTTAKGLKASEKVGGLLVSRHIGSHFYSLLPTSRGASYSWKDQESAGDWVGLTGCRPHLSRAILSCLLYLSTQEPHG